MKTKSVEIVVKGLVQGVGFRPFIYRIACSLSLTGWVQNTNENVRIAITGNEEAIDRFVVSLEQDAPPAAMIESISVSRTGSRPFNEFRILNSDDISEEITEISPDIAVCIDCLDDMDNQANRISYPFVNCTNCGPRFTIIEDLPYDRANTTMKHFMMCPECSREYETITDRRFHAQPVACNNCGPGYVLLENGSAAEHDIEKITDRLSGIAGKGGVFLLKGLGGMHLACDAFNEHAVGKIRNIKRRDGKPFALMFRDIVSLKEYVFINKEEEKALLSWQRPITLLRMKNGKTTLSFPAGLNSGLDMLGVMLPYMPFHYLLFRKLGTPAIVLTSGNFSNEPIITDNNDAIRQFSETTDAVLLHDRDIYNRTDDSVVRIISGKERVFRRSRGYVPAAVRTGLNAEGVIAFGAELTNCFCMGKGEKAFLSQHIGDLQSVENAIFYEETIARFIKLFRIKPSLIAVDLHPSYISTRTGLSFGDLPVTKVQHHHAHIASCMAEHHLDEKVIGVSFDGTGYGTDGNIWGSEFMVCDLIDFKRMAHFEYIPLPGGDTAVEEPWRMALSWLYRVYGKRCLDMDIPPVNIIDKQKMEILIRMTDRNINCPLTCGAGRFFDAVASLLGLADVATFQAEGPMRLESLIQEGIGESYPFYAGSVIGLGDTIKAIVDDIESGVKIKTIAAKLHNTVIMIIFDTVRAIRSGEGINKVVLSGGVFQNKYLLEGSIRKLLGDGFGVYTQAAVPSNDGGIALGQLAIASKRREMKCV